MKALILERSNELIYKEVPDPQIEPDEVLVKSGLVGSAVLMFMEWMAALAGGNPH